MNLTENSKVAIIISTYQRKELLKRSLESLFNSFDKITPHNIIVLDDGSDDGTDSPTQETCKQENLTWIRSNENRGLRRTLHQLLDHVYSYLNVDYICYCQDDIEYQKGWLDKCVARWEFFQGDYGFITGHDAPEHPVKRNLENGDLEKDTCRATHLFASTERWKEFGEIPDLTPGIAAPKPGHGSLVDWWLIGHPDGVFPESKSSLKNKGEKVLCIPGLIKHMAKEPTESTWYCKTFERERLIPNRIGIQIITRNRPEYLSTLLTSLRTQTIQEFDLFIVDNSDSPVSDNHQVKSLLERMSWEGHRVKYIRHPERDIGFLRNLALDMDNCEFGCRIDDDSVCEIDMLEKLLRVFSLKKNVGCVGPLVPFMHAEKQFKELPPKMCRMTKFFDVTDESIWFYNTDKEFVDADHIRSSMMYRNEVAKKIRHPEGFGRTGYREETVFSYRFKIHGYDNYYVPLAVCWHFAAPNGGGRDIDNPTETWFLNDQRMKELLSKEVDSMPDRNGMGPRARSPRPKGKKAGMKQGAC